MSKRDSIPIWGDFRIARSSHNNSSAEDNSVEGSLNSEIEEYSIEAYLETIGNSSSPLLGSESSDQQEPSSSDEEDNTPREDLLRDDENEIFEILMGEVKVTATLTKDLHCTTKRGVMRGTPMTLVEFVRQSDKDQFVRECLTLKNLRHSNLLQFVGYLTDPFGIIFEDVDQGTLHQLLARKELRITHANVMNVLLSVSKALRYLHSQKPPILHKRVSSKAVMIGNDWGNVKLWGHCITAYSQERKQSLRRSSQSEVQISFTKKSDVSSFATLIWECVERKEGSPRSINDITKNCPGFLRELMISCWGDEKKRPTFKEINNYMIKMQQWFGKKKNCSRSVHQLQWDNKPSTDQCKIRYVKRLSFCTTESNEDLMERTGRVWKSMQDRMNYKTRSGPLSICSHDGIMMTSYICFDNIDDLRSGMRRLHRAQSEDVNREMIGGDHNDMRICKYEMNDWDIRKQCDRCISIQFDIHTTGEITIRNCIQNRLLSLFRHYSEEYKGLMMLFNQKDNIIITIFTTKKGAREMKEKGTIARIWEELQTEKVISSTPLITKSRILTMWSS